MFERIPRLCVLSNSSANKWLTTLGYACAHKKDNRYTTRRNRVLRTNRAEQIQNRTSGAQLPITPRTGSRSEMMNTENIHSILRPCPTGALYAHAIQVIGPRLPNKS